jgi:3-dehydroquinate dehydratase-2
MKVLVLNGPNLNLLGERDPDLYGPQTLDEVEDMCRERARDLGLEVECRHSNFEGELIDWLHDARRSAQGVVLNPGALAHYSRALADAVEAATVPVVEVHITNIYAREPWRATSVISPVAWGVITGVGVQGYLLGLDALAVLLQQESGAEGGEE